MSHVADLTDRRLASVLGRAQVEGRLPSIVAGVLRDGELVWTGAHGTRTGTTPPGPDLQYRIGSITKTMTMVLVLQLREEGRLSLGDTVGQHLPGAGYADLTVRDLLSHSGGMQSEPDGSWWERSPGVSVEELLSANDGSLAALERGASYHYSNLGFGMLGEIAARLNEQTWWDCVRHRILTPLGMARTSYSAQSPSATGYSVHHFASTLTEEPAADTGAMAPAGQLWSTVEDLATYTAFLLDGHPDVLPLSALLEASTPQSGSLAGSATGGYGLALRILAGPQGALVGHTGSMPGFLATLFVDRARHTGVFALANGTSGMATEPLARAMLDTLEACEPTVPTAWQPAADVPAEVAEVLGVWHWGNTAYGFAWDGHEVVATHLQSNTISYRFGVIAGRLVGTSGYHHGEELVSGRRADGSVDHLTCATFVYTRTPYDPEVTIPGGHPPQ